MLLGQNDVRNAIEWKLITTFFSIIKVVPKNQNARGKYDVITVIAAI